MIALIAAISTVSAAPRQSAQLSPPPGFTSPISRQLQDVLAKKSSVKIGDTNVEAALLRRVYESRGYRPIWTENGNSENEVKRVLDQLSHAADDGLDPQNYRGDQLSASLSKGEKTDFELLMTDSVLRYLGAGIAVSYANQVGSAANTLLTSYKTETQRNFFSYDAATTAAGPTIANGERLRISPQAYYYYKSFGLLTEYVSESQDVSRTFGTGANALIRRARLKPDSWQVGATFLVTGDDATFGTVIPKRPFALDDPGWGALELAARVSQLKLDSATFFTPAGTAAHWFADPSAQAREATAWTLGLNWYLTQNVAWNLDYTKTNFDGGAPDGKNRADESAIFTRFQVAF